MSVGMNMSQLGLGQHQAWPKVGGGGRVSPLNLRGVAVSPVGATEEGQAWSLDIHTVG